MYEWLKHQYDHVKSRTYHNQSCRVFYACTSVVMDYLFLNTYQTDFHNSAAFFPACFLFGFCRPKNIKFTNTRCAVFYRI